MKSFLSRAYYGADGITYHHPAAFWGGVLAVTLGVVMHFPMFLDSAPMGYKMVGMSMSDEMTAAMLMIVAGIGLTGYGLYPTERLVKNQRNYTAKVHVMDDIPLNKAHIALLFTLTIALIVDMMKPATLGFVVPGTAAEYGLSKSEVSLIPFAGLLGTAIGSILYGWLADSIGRRASILLAAIVFIATSICGAMPSFTWNIIMCFLMGLGAGGMLPIVFALLAEMIPVKHRGWLMVLIGGIGTLGGYFIASACAALLEPIYGWRILWFLGLPTGLLLIFMNHYIPESVRFLEQNNQHEQAKKVLLKFNAVANDDNIEEKKTESHSSVTMLSLFSPPYSFLTLALTFTGLAWGLVNFGFIMWLPLQLREMGIDAAATGALLASSSLIALPTIFLVALLYQKWSTHKSLILFTSLTGVALLAFILMIQTITSTHWLLVTLIATIMVSSGAMISMLTPYSSEIYPNNIRATGAGIVAASSKLGGVFALALAVLWTIPDIVTTAWLAIAPISITIILLMLFGIETKNRSLEEISNNSKEDLNKSG